jgi:hypothetical protein
MTPRRVRVGTDLKRRHIEQIGHLLSVPLVCRPTWTLLPIHDARPGHAATRNPDQAAADAIDLDECMVLLADHSQYAITADPVTGES